MLHLAVWPILTCLHHACIMPDHPDACTRVTCPGYTHPPTQKETWPECQGDRRLQLSNCQLLKEFKRVRPGVFNFNPLQHVYVYVYVWLTPSVLKQDCGRLNRAHGVTLWPSVYHDDVATVFTAACHSLTTIMQLAVHHTEVSSYYSSYSALF